MILPGRGESIFLYALFISVTALSLDIVLPAYPVIAEEFSLRSPTPLQGNILLFVVGMLFGELLSGPLADRLGRRKTMFGCVGVFAAGTGICMAAPNYETLILGRALQGVGAAGFKICTRAIIRDRFSGADMAKLMSFVMATFIFLPFVAPAIGDYLTRSFGWRSIYVFLALHAAAIAIWFLMRHPETLPDLGGEAVGKRNILRGCAIFFRTRQSVIYTLAAGILFGVHLGFISLSPLIFAEVYGVTDEFPLYFGAMVCAFGMALLLNGRFVISIGMQKMIDTGLLLTAITQMIFLALYLWKGEAEFILFFVYIFILLFSLGLIFGNSTALIMEPVGKIAGTASALSSSLSTAIAVPVSTLLGLFYNKDIGSFCGPVLLFTLSALLIVRFMNRPPLPFSPPGKSPR